MWFLTLLCNVTLSLHIYIEANECYLNETLQPTLGWTFVRLELTREAASSNAPTRQLTRVVDKTAFPSVACLFLIFILEKMECLSGTHGNVRRNHFGLVFTFFWMACILSLSLSEELCSHCAAPRGTKSEFHQRMCSRAQTALLSSPSSSYSFLLFLCLFFLFFIILLYKPIKTTSAHSSCLAVPLG